MPELGFETTEGGVAEDAGGLGGWAIANGGPEEVIDGARNVTLADRTNSPFAQIPN